jgi:hypothetical protein
MAAGNTSTRRQPPAAPLTMVGCNIFGWLEWIAVLRLRVGSAEWGQARAVRSVMRNKQGEP